MKKILGLLVLASVATFANNIDFRVNAGAAYHSASESKLNIFTPSIQAEGVKTVADFEGLELRAGLGLNGAFRNFSAQEVKVGDTVDGVGVTQLNKSLVETELKSQAQKLSGVSLVPYAIAEAGAKIQNFDVYAGANLGYGLHFNSIESEIQKGLDDYNKALSAATTDEQKTTIKERISAIEKKRDKVNPRFVYKGYIGGAYNNFRAELGYGNLSGLSVTAGYGLEF